jgi:endo-1,4-beta-xylanase
VFSPSYGQLAKDKCKFLGNIIGGSIPTGFEDYWNQVTPENAGKWGSVEATKDAMAWDQLDAAYNYAKENNLPFKQHTFVWGQQQPSWLAGLTPAEQKHQVEEWIQAFCERYPDTDYIDVVNEPLHETPVYAEALGGSGATGWDWVIWAFEQAKEHCPKAKRILNEYNVLNNGSAANQYVAIIKLLKDRQLIDYIGEQGHNLETTPNATISSNLDKLAATGLPILISEYDLNFSSDSEQKAKYESQFPILWGHPGVHGVTLWGYRQGAIWRTDAYLLRSNGTERPAMEWLRTYVKQNQGGIFCLTTGMNEENDGSNEFAVYPNPTSGKFEVNSADVTVKDMHGRTIISKTGAPPLSFDLQSGFYIIQTSTVVEKLVVK